jgi:hypothetical protein
MREFLFRAKRKDNGEWIESSGLHSRLGNSYIVGISKKGRKDFWEVDTETVGQYTGLTDKNGKRIFEGDIVEEKFGERVCGCYAVNMNEERGGWFPFACGDGCGCCEAEVAMVENCEVIGNIHDNPELLKEGC